MAFFPSTKTIQENHRLSKRAINRRQLRLEALEDRTLLAVTAVTSVSDPNFLFESDNQNMWQQGPGDIITKTFEWNPGRISFPASTIGGFIGLPNPAYAPWAACYLLPAPSSVAACDAVLGSPPSTTLASSSRNSVVRTIQIAGAWKCNQRGFRWQWSASRAFANSCPTVHFRLRTFKQSTALDNVP